MFRSTRISTLWRLAAALALIPAAASAADPSPISGPVRFDDSIAPLWASRCLNCHSGSEAKGDLDLTRRGAAFKTTADGSLLVAGQPEESLLWRKVRDDEMPPDHPLPDDEKELIRAWIEAGATWGTDPIDPLRYTTAARAGYDWWSLQPLAPVTIPQSDDAWPRNAIDRFVLQRLQQAGLQPSPEADPRALIRRLFCDLIGLPPTPEEIEAFAAQPSESAYAALVDRLLASPAYGERWARHWLDIARFGESNGFERNDPRDNFWPYRDWVIAALNADMPYDEFVRRQIAGDLLDGGIEGAAAVGFLVAGVHNTVVGSSERMKRLARQDELEEVAGAVGQSFLGLTINCARCHDHKFDPIRNEEYYRFIAALDGVQHGERQEVAPLEAAQLVELRRETAEREGSLAALDREARQRLGGAGLVAGVEIPQPAAAWSFEDGLTDAIGGVSATLEGGARIDQGALVVDGVGAFAASGTIDRSFTEKTLETWVEIDNLDQRGGGVISLEIPDGSAFDAIVFGELESRRWMAGSEGFVRTQSFQATAEEATPQQPVHIAITYHRDGNVTAYRDGRPYGSGYRTNARSFASGTARVLFGLRHSPAGGNKFFSGRILQANLYDRALNDEQVAALRDRGPDTFGSEMLASVLTEAERRMRADLQRQLADCRARIQELESRRQPVYTVSPGQPGAMPIHIRGSVTDFGPDVTAGGVRSVTGHSADFGLTLKASDRKRRLQLARWITVDARHLLCRVIVNRLWQHHFGAGLVETPNDFGFNGGRPSHPELLDWMAMELQQQGFRLKPLHRQIVMSAAYRQSSAMNPEAFAQDGGNRLLWRHSPQRVEAEVLRDSILQAAGVLTSAGGGPGYRDVEITALNGTTYYEPIEEDRPEFHRRSIYRFVPRGGASGVLETFDCPDPSVTTPQRSSTTTPLQALSLMNNGFVLSMSARLAERAATETAEPGPASMIRVWRLCLGRVPSSAELQASQELVGRHGLAALARALFNTHEFVVLE